uniref:Putative LAGLIDADG homing endonuclease n=1 Tax=Sarcinofilum mucosum TaxID=141643 RepID=A0A1W6EGD2_SARMC|nr:putative LAGLIDADG homing endonuclease [Sarcinofilum mucosum]YP_009367481.1 putative LAGLIDADG homing endonuclease [Sarcinofilum mucosum]ARK14449.1 putative LAGLIDADG homing endonuclease [Sarcinofilum mucosum]ARK14451.1 putative LAGLIDADG homing endonuclease [Sarcinofilum mucosum]
MALDTLILSKEEEAVFLGNLLGDGHIQKRGNSYRTKIQHSIHQKEYVLWKYEKLKRLCDKNHLPKAVTTKNSTQENFLFYLNSGLYLEKYHSLFYKPYFWKAGAPDIVQNTPSSPQNKIRYQKVITQALIEALPRDPLLLAVWFLDDGSCRQDVFSGRIATQSFTLEEQHLLQDYLKQGFGINTQLVLHNRIKRQYYISIPSSKNQFANFVDLIKPVVEKIPDLKYKIKNPRND